ncbi:hypothetical protein M3O96_11155 [Aquiflexum sp. TKW24L]|uniref:hypothetical protein n=1 Tax=Aquiflexum sp. TKW24L TaxID=2942212 RepID=UPI0020C012AF|nr:hypothetical protein [Aquiflexum sp. TKW24L]MCL6259652.1 hypothetical protein [Aquiflexum sp. TKW24L]
MFGRLRKKAIIKYITYILLVNFINLTANFYQVSSLDNTLLKYEDPYDSLSELILEYFLEMDEDTVPDTELPEDKRKMLDIKTVIGNETFQFDRHLSNITVFNNIFASDMYKNIVFGIISPPPKS